MEFARIAARHFGTEHHEYYVTPADTWRVAVIAAATTSRSATRRPCRRTIAPGSRASTASAHARRRRRRRAVRRQLALRAAVQLSLYEHIPALDTPRHDRTGGTQRCRADQRLTLLRKASSYVEQARQPMPDRDTRVTTCWPVSARTTSSRQTSSRIDRSQTAVREMREVYAAADARSLINRMLAIDSSSRWPTTTCQR